MSLEVILISGRTVQQGEAIEAGKTQEYYAQTCAICELDPDDMDRIGVKEGDLLKVTTEAGEVTVKTVKSKQAPHMGIAFIPMGTWANVVIGYATSSTGMPSYKGIHATIEPDRDGMVLGPREIVDSLFASIIEKKGNV